MPRNRSSANYVIIAVILAVLFGVAAWMNRETIFDVAEEAVKPDLPDAVSFDDIKELPVPAPEPSPAPTPKPVPSKPPELPKPSQPSEINLAVPFTSQAPFANWDEVHEETCEEAVVLMVAKYYQGVKEGQLDKQAAEDELQGLVATEMRLFGYYKDTTARETGMLAKEQYGLSYRLLMDPTIEDIKKEVAAGRPVLVPTAGRELGNPNFSGLGPIYHMIVIRGYAKDRFITNDPGTRKGEEYTYAFETIMNAIHDWNAEDIQKGGRVVLVLEK